MSEIFWGLGIPFFGTVLGAVCVFFMHGGMNRTLHRGLAGVTAGIMAAASVWCLLIPALEESAPLGQWAFIPSAIGFAVGAFFLLFLHHWIPHRHGGTAQVEESPHSLTQILMLILAVSFHNISEGMAVGVVCAGIQSGHGEMTIIALIALSIGIAIHNFPESAMISMSLRDGGLGKMKSFLGSIVAGIMGPIGSILTILLTALVVPLLPYLLSFAAGGMIYVVVEELIPTMSTGKHSDIGIIAFTIGFILMMSLDVALG